MKQVLVAAALAALALSTTVSKTTAASGAYYTAAQASSGAKLYAANCAQCHGAKLEGVSAPPLSGAAMKGSQSVASLYSYMATNMPAGHSGELPAKTYAAIFAYLLQKNGHPAGSVALTAAAAKKIQAKI